VVSASAASTDPSLPGPVLPVLAAALVVVPYVLSKLNTAVPHAMTVLDWRSKLSRPGQIFFFEAFVTNQGSSRPDTRNVEDARRAVDAFQRGMLRPEEFNSATDEPNCFNLLGAMLL
jgi:hypothetical protein